MRMGFDYGLSKRWMIGIGRSTYQKQFDGFTKYKILSQVTGGMPVTVSGTAGIMYKSLKFDTRIAKIFSPPKCITRHNF